MSFIINLFKNRDLNSINKKHVSNTVKSTGSTVEELGRSINDINAILTSITQISEQTNLLVLNAYIEEILATMDEQNTRIINTSKVIKGMETSSKELEEVIS
ncbi:methyl-accepting chemotaxis protein [Clostridium punense]|uniref:Methyl-accepting chemotaxis protein n=1 Tax=Clostridium punense TaxID=1054297 RepID=A0ABS4K8E9_9CLOT|nr:MULTISPECIES: hypothetical protein [Clostridium]EQB88338.1 hypothetical protein M918_04730 [Clostridium sp. BL8]MBP2023526.1 methyl-accepting chemotaxis protein [Clostridium punense]